MYLLRYDLLKLELLFPTDVERLATFEFSRHSADAIISTNSHTGLNSHTGGSLHTALQEEGAQILLFIMYYLQGQ